MAIYCSHGSKEQLKQQQAAAATRDLEDHIRSTVYGSLLYSRLGPMLSGVAILSNHLAVLCHQYYWCGVDELIQGRALTDGMQYVT
jgi:hypothetical protein